MNSVLSGIKPTGAGLHIGNYFGAVKYQVELQDKYDQAIYFIADLHALTTVQNRKEMENNIKNVILDYLALGVNPNKTIFFRQSDVPAHSELNVILSNYISIAHMKRMHAYKDRIANNIGEADINMGVFNYPILMAADILAYQVDGVPVGEDQKQHVELARDIAESFNKTYKTDFFKLPEPLILPDVGRIIGTDGKKKMSKSLKNTIEIFEDEKVIKKQIMSSFTDPTRKKATDKGHVENNPVFIYHDLLNTNKEEVKDLKKRYQKGLVGDVEVKEKLFIAHQNYFKEAKLKRMELEKDDKLIDKLLKIGAEKASIISNKTLNEVKEIVGLNFI